MRIIYEFGASLANDLADPVSEAVSGAQDTAEYTLIDDAGNYLVDDLGNYLVY